MIPVLITRTVRKMCAMQRHDSAVPDAARGFGVAHLRFLPTFSTSRCACVHSVHVGENRLIVVFRRMSEFIDRADDRSRPATDGTSKKSTCSPPMSALACNDYIMPGRSPTKPRPTVRATLCALSYHRSNRWTVDGNDVDIKCCGEFATTASGNCRELRTLD
jgi:hypothetical protein